MQDPFEMWPLNFIHPTAIIDTSVRMGTRNIIGPYTVIGPDVTIGDSNRIEGHASIGSPAEHKDFFTGRGSYGVRIGSSNTIREFTTINSGTVRTTTMQNDCIMLRGSHLSHDSIMEDRVTLSCNVLVGGHSYIMEGANCGLGSIIHQYQTIGAYAMLGMGAIVPRSFVVKPGRVYYGNPVKETCRRNDIGLERGGVTDNILRQLADKFWLLKGVTK